MVDEVDRFRRDCVPSLLAYLTRRDEAGRRAAYELGRRAMQDSIGVLEVTRVHHDSLLAVMATARTAPDALEMAHAGGEFLLEMLAPFEIAQRGFLDVSLGRNPPDSGGSAAPPRRPT